MPQKKTTIYLPEALRRRLREAALRRDCSVNDLLILGAEKLLDADVGASDAATLKQRAAQAWERLRGGLFEGPPIGDRLDEIIYGQPALAREAAPEYPSPLPPGRRAPRTRKRRGS